MRSVLIPVSESSMIGEARREVTSLAGELALDATELGRAAIIATELATNLCRHANGGQLLVQRAGATGTSGIEILAFDRGPGIDDLSVCLRDGFSSAGTSGIGLGAVRRLSDEFDIHSRTPAGTVVVSRVLRAAGAAGEPALHHCGICVPAPAETECGDAFCVSERGSRIGLMIADGLGHGPLAAAAARKAAELFAASATPEPDAFLAEAQEALRQTRGAAIAALRLDLETRKVRYAGIGNISARLLAGQRGQGLVTIGGTVGLEQRRVLGFDYEWPPDAVLVMHSDGLGSRWDLWADPSLPGKHPAIIAAVLYRDHARGSDDVTVLVARLRDRAPRARGAES